MNRVWAACRAAAFTRARLGGKADPALRPDPGLLARDPLGLVPSLRASRFLRRLHRYYEPVRLPTSARMAAPAVPCRHPPPETNPADPVGPLRFRRWPSIRDAALDPGGATPSRMAMAHMLPSLDGNQLGLRDLQPFEA